MSKPNPKRTAKSSSRKPRDAEKDESSDRNARSAATTATATATTSKAADDDTKDDTNSDSKKDASNTEDTPAPKPPSAGATIRDACQKLLNLTMKQEWTSIDPVLKQLEKIVANSGGELKPLVAVLDPVSMKNEKEKRICVFTLCSVTFCSVLLR